MDQQEESMIVYRWTGIESLGKSDWLFVFMTSSFMSEVPVSGDDMEEERSCWR